GVAKEFTPGFGLELGVDLSLGRNRLALIGGYHANAGLFSDDRTELSLQLEAKRMLALDDMVRPYGMLGIGAAFATVTECESVFGQPDDKVTRTERRAIGRIGLGLEVGAQDGLAFFLQAGALARYAPRSGATPAFRLGGQMSLGLRLSL
ncbi:MAG: hypothetical protein AAF411_19635, partial [Myxococcota bacterium]